MAGLSIFDDSIPFYIGENKNYGINSAIMILLFSPILMAIVGFFHCFLLWYPLIKLYNYLKNRL